MDALVGNRRVPVTVRLSHSDGELYYINLLSIGFRLESPA